MNTSRRWRSEAKLDKKKFVKFLVVGMGGSHLAADILKAWHPELDVIVWSNYGLPRLREKDLRERLVILSSYSGSTEEVIDAFNAARAKHLPWRSLPRAESSYRSRRSSNCRMCRCRIFICSRGWRRDLSLMAFLAVMGEKAWIERGKAACDTAPSRRARNTAGATLQSGCTSMVPIDLRFCAERRDREQLENKIQRDGEGSRILERRSRTEP